jgi:hypothetical protein
MFKQIDDFLIPYFTTKQDREALLVRAFGLDHPLIRMVNYNQDTKDFTTNLVNLLDDYGLLDNGRLALWQLLSTVKPQVDRSHWTTIDNFYDWVHRNIVASTPPKTITSIAAIAANHTATAADHTATAADHTTTNCVITCAEHTAIECLEPIRLDKIVVLVILCACELPRIFDGT